MESKQYAQASFALQLRIIRENLSDMQRLIEKTSARFSDAVTDEFFRQARRYCDGVSDLVVRLSDGVDDAPAVQNGESEQAAFLDPDLLS